MKTIIFILCSDTNNVTDRDFLDLRVNLGNEGDDLGGVCGVYNVNQGIVFILRFQLLFLLILFIFVFFCLNTNGCFIFI